MPRYLFYNPTGHDTATLRATKADDVIPVPFGWTEEIEAARNKLLGELGISISALPALVIHVEEATAEDADGSTIVIPAHWEEIRIADEVKGEWSMAKLNEAVTARREKIASSLEASKDAGAKR